MTEPTVSFGPYVLLDLLGKGGLSEVFLAAHSDPSQSKTWFALKRLLPSMALRKEMVDHLTREAKIGALLDSPSIVKIFDLGLAEGQFFITMEWVRGRSLKQIFERGREIDEEIPLTALCYIVDRVASALAYAHSLKDGAGRPLEILHCDLSPDNILVGYDGSVRLSDFGMAAASREEGVKKSAALVGKLSYLPPERIRGESVDRRSDLYSLAAIWYEGLAGRSPLVADSRVELELKILEETPAPLPEQCHLPPRLSKLLEKSLSKSPNERPDDAEAFRREFEASDLSEGRRALSDLMTRLFSSEYFREELRDRELRGMMARRLPANLLDEDITEEEASADSESTETVVAAGTAEETRVESIPHASKVLTKIPLVRRALGSLFETDFLGSGAQATDMSERGSAPASETRPPELRRLPSIPWSDILAYLPSLPQATGALAVLAAVVFVTLGIRWALSPNPATKPLAIQTIEIFITVEGNVRPEEREKMGQWLLPNFREKFWIVPIRDIFRKEHERYKKSAAPLIFRIAEPRIELAPMAPRGTFLSPVKPFRELWRQFGLKPSSLNSVTGRFFIHLYPVKPGENPRYPVEYDGVRPPGQSLLFLPIRESRSIALPKIVHEVGHLLGGTEKVDGQGMPSYPYGFVEPHRLPLYPQRHAEIMTRGIPVSPLSQKPIADLSDMRVGYRTAREFGWISADESDRYFEKVTTFSTSNSLR